MLQSCTGAHWQQFKRSSLDVDYNKILIYIWGGETATDINNCGCNNEKLLLLHFLFFIHIQQTKIGIWAPTLLSKKCNGSSPDAVGGVVVGMECMCPCWNGWFCRWGAWNRCREKGEGGTQQWMKNTMKIILFAPTAWITVAPWLTFDVSVTTTETSDPHSFGFNGEEALVM